MAFEAIIPDLKPVPGTQIMFEQPLGLSGGAIVVPATVLSSELMGSEMGSFDCLTPEGIRYRGITYVATEQLGNDHDMITTVKAELFYS